MDRVMAPYTPAIRSGEWLICSGQVGQIDGVVIEDGFASETRQALENLRGLLEANGSSLSEVVKTTVFLTDISNLETMNVVYGEAFGDHWPARSTVAVTALPLSASFEIEAWARVE